MSESSFNWTNQLRRLNQSHLMRRISLIAFLLLPFLAQAQFSENLQSDRPGQTYSANTIGKRTIQIQAGYVYSDQQYLHKDRDEATRGGHERNTARNYGNLYLRFGLFEKTEIGGQISFGREQIESSGDDYNFDAEQNVEQFGFAIRQNILEQEKSWLNLTVLAEYFNDESDGIDNASLIVAASKSLTKRITIATNIGYGFDNEMLITLNGSFMPIEKLGVFVEYAPFYSEVSRFTSDECFKMQNSNLNTGLFYQVTPNLMLDAAAYFQTYDIAESNYNVESSNFSFQVGLTNRLNWRK